MLKALYSCGTDMNNMDLANEHIDILRPLCDDKESCTVKACNSFWGTSHECESNDPAMAWINWRSK